MTDLSEALLAYLKAAKNYEKAAESCQYDRDYFLRHEREALQAAEDKFVHELANHVVLARRE